jgi:hypothetical protein
MECSLKCVYAPVNNPRSWSEEGKWKRSIRSHLPPFLYYIHLLIKYIRILHIVLYGNHFYPSSKWQTCWRLGSCRKNRMRRRANNRRTHGIMLRHSIWLFRQT